MQTLKSENRKLEIILVASGLFKEKGFNAVSMRDIAQVMGIKAASLYNHIASKQEILSIIIMEVVHKFTSGMNEIIASDTTIIEKLEQIIEQHVNITVENTDALGSLNNDWMHLEEPDLSRFIEMRDQYEENFRQLIRAGIKNKQLIPINEEVMLFSILSTLRTLYLWHQRKEGIDKHVMIVQMKKVLLKGVILNVK